MTNDEEAAWRTPRPVWISPWYCPNHPHERDACVGRLMLLLQAKGLDRAHVVADQAGTHLCIHFNTGSLAVTDVRRLATAAGAELSMRYAHASLRIGGMDCSTCANVIEHALARIDGVLEAEVSYAAERLRLEFDREKTSLRAVNARLEILGYRVIPEPGATNWWVDHRELACSLTAGALLLAGWIGFDSESPARDRADAVRTGLCTRRILHPARRITESARAASRHRHSDARWGSGRGRARRPGRRRASMAVRPGSSG